MVRRREGLLSKLPRAISTNRNIGYLHHNDGYYDRNVLKTNCVSCSFDRYMSVFEMTVCTNLMDSPSQTDAFLE